MQAPGDSESVEQTLSSILQAQQRLEARVAALEALAAASSSKPLATPAAVDTSEFVPAPLFPTTEKPPASAALEARFGLTLVNRIGVITLILGVAFFFKWAADNDWIGPGTRVLLGLAAGVVAICVADLLWRKGQQTFAQGISGLGIALCYLAGYAAFGLYHLLPLYAAFALLVCVTAAALLLSLRYGAQAIAALGLFGGYLTPVLLSTGEDRPWFLFSYLLLMNAAALRLGNKRLWRGLDVLALASSTIIYASWLNHDITSHHHLLVATIAPLVYLGAFAALSFPTVVIPAACLCALAVGTNWSTEALPFFGLQIGVAAGALLYGLWRSAGASWLASFATFWIIYFVFFERSQPALAGVTAAFLVFCSAALWKALDTTATREYLALLPLSGVLYWLAVYARFGGHHTSGVALLTLSIGLVYFGIAWFIRTVHPRTAALEYLAGHGFVLLACTLETIDWADHSVSVGSRVSFTTMWLSIIYAGYALILVAAGVATRTILNRLAGLALVAFVILKLYAFDVWQLDRVYRITAFVGLGLLLISTSFLYSRFRALIENLVLPGRES